MKLKAEISADTVDVEITSDGDKTFARVGGRSYELVVSEPEPGVFLLKNAGHVYEATALRTAAGAFRVSVRNKELEIKITDPKRLRGSGGAGEHASGKAEIKTAMPGKVVRILRSAGDAVQKGQGVIVVEAMKMQNEIRSPKDGTIKELKVAESDTVAAGDVLVVIE